MSVLISSVFNPILACAVCTGQLDDVQSKAANMGIFVMLLVLLGVFVAVLAFIVNLARRSRQVMTETEFNER